MRNEDNDCIRYLMKEMDPSEEVLMERAMMEDENLLIEVESMRQTLQKLDSLPEVEPPSHLTESIVEKAAKHKEHKRNKFVPIMPAVKYTVAAAVALTVTAGGMWLSVENYDNNYTSEENITAESHAVTGNSPVNSSSLISTQTFDASILPVNESGISPWIDRNDVIHFEDQFSNGRNDFDSILQTTTRKLRPLHESINQREGVRSLHLTGGN